MNTKNTSGSSHSTDIACQKGSSSESRTKQAKTVALLFAKFVLHWICIEVYGRAVNNACQPELERYQKCLDPRQNCSYTIPALFISVLYTQKFLIEKIGSFGLAAISFSLNQMTKEEKDKNKFIKKSEQSRNHIETKISNSLWHFW